MQIYNLHKRFLTIWTCCFFLLFVSKVEASHIVGGEMTYRCLGGSLYQIELTIFRDCENGFPQAYFDDPVPIGIFAGSTGNLLSTEYINWSGLDDTLDLTLANPCFVVPPNVCIHTTTYSTVLNLPFRVGGYHLAYQRCCRNNIINNILNPSTTGATYDVLITEQALATCNSSPRFFDWPPFYICQGAPLNYNSSAIDIDGDSIVYELCNPYVGGTQGNPSPDPPNGPPYSSVFWQPPYTLSNMLGGSDPLVIDPVTGILTGTPGNLGTFVVGLCAKEYRNGVLIGTTKRDFQFTTGSCNKINQAQFFTPNAGCRTNLGVYFNNISNAQSPSYLWDLGDGTTSTSFDPFHTYPDTGQYTVTLIAGFGTACSDTISQVIDLQINGLDIQLNGPQTVCEGDTVLVTVQNLLSNYNTITSVNWSSNTSFIGPTNTDSVYVVVDDLTTVSLQAQNNFGCIDSDDIQIETEIVIADFDTLSNQCNTNLSVLFQNTSTALNESFFWDFDGLATSTDIYPTFTFPDTGSYTITLIAGFGGQCTDTIVQDIDLQLTGIDLQITPDQQICSGDEVVVNVTNIVPLNSTTISYDWTSSDSILSGLNGPTITVSPLGSTTYTVYASNEFDCIDSASIFIDVLISESSFDSTDLLCNGSLTIPFSNTSQVSSGGFLWQFDTLGTSSDVNPIFTFSDTGLYTIQLISGVGTPCLDTSSQLLPLYISQADISSSDSSIVCRGDTVSLYAYNNLSAYNQIVDYTWTPFEPIINGQGTDSVDLIASSDQTFMVVATNNYGCTDTSFSVVNVTFLSPALSVIALPDSIFLGQSSQLYATNFLEYTYDWVFDTTLSDLTIHNPIARPREDRTYYIYVSNQFGCILLDSVRVYIKPPSCENPVVFIPNAFTPDGDGYNDILRVEGTNITEMVFMIFDRWGQKVFETNDQSIGWDGSFKGKQVNPDVFGYYMRCRCDNGEYLQLKGNITLIR